MGEESRNPNIKENKTNLAKRLVKEREKASCEGKRERESEVYQGERERCIRDRERERERERERFSKLSVMN